jgi:hypothetical protein
VLEGVPQPLLLVADLARLGLQRVRVAPGPDVLLGRGQVPLPLRREPVGAAEALLQRGQPIPGLLGAGQGRRVGGDRRLQLGLPGLGPGQLALDDRAPLPDRALVGDLAGQRGAQRDQVVGEQPQPGVAQV